MSSILKEVSKKDMLNGLIANLDVLQSKALEDFEVNKGKGEYSSLDMYDISGVKDFYETLIKLEQWDDDFSGNFGYKVRLVKINRFLDVITRMAHQDTLKIHILRGLFLELEVCLIPNRFISSCKVRKGNSSVECLVAPMYPQEVGLPGNDDVIWGTLRRVNSNYCAALSCRGDQKWLKGWIDRSSAWEYVKVD